MRCLLLCAVVVGAVACGGGPSALLDERVLSRLEKAEDVTFRSGDQALIKDMGGCLSIWQDKEWLPFIDAAASDSTNPKYEQLPLEGSWDFANCKVVATDLAVPDGSVCAGQVTLSEQAGGHISQTNVSARSQGSGQVMYAMGTGAGKATFLMNSNHAEGSGCTQEVVNLWTIVPTQGKLNASIFSAILDSTCAAAEWKCVIAQME